MWKLRIKEVKWWNLKFKPISEHTLRFRHCPRCLQQWTKHTIHAPHGANVLMLFLWKWNWSRGTWKEADSSSMSRGILGICWLIGWRSFGLLECQGWFSETVFELWGHLYHTFENWWESIFKCLISISSVARGKQVPKGKMHTFLYSLSEKAKWILICCQYA